MTWDQDEKGSGTPPIAGEMTSVFVPSETVGKQTSTFGTTGASISEWLLDAQNIRNPVEVYEWDIEESADSTLHYRMEEWQLKWFFSISSEPTDDELPFLDLIDSKRNALTDVQVWFEFDLSPIWYFENMTNAYFCIATIRLSDFQLGGKLGGTDYEDDFNPECRVLPMSPNTPLGIYYGLYGTSVNSAEKVVHDYEGRKLNPALFTDKVYAYFTLQDFGMNAWREYLQYKYRADVVTVGFDVHVFVIGEWLVKEIQDLPDEYGRTAKTGSGGFAWADFLQALYSPTTSIWLLLAIIAIVIIFLAIFFPQVLFGLSRATKDRGKT